MTIRAKLYYHHFDEEGEINAEKQLARITLTGEQEDEKGFIMEVSIEMPDGTSCSTLINFLPDALGINTNGRTVTNGDFTFVFPIQQEDEEE